MWNTNSSNTQSKPVLTYKRDLQDIYRKLKENITVNESDHDFSKTEIKNKSKEKSFDYMPMIQTIENTPVQIKEELPALDKPKQEINSKPQFEQTKLMDAVIWSEILGEPRSKRPYARRKWR